MKPTGLNSGFLLVTDVLLLIYAAPAMMTVH